METPKVYAAIAAVIKDMSECGISKDRKNVQQGYSFRGIDDVYNALSGMLATHNLCILPTVLSRDCIERETKNGGTLFYTVVQVRFDFVSAEDGSKHEVTTYGEAMDSGDKSTNKAMSAAYKYAAMQAFCIPTEGDNDADSTTHEVKPKSVSKPAVSQPSAKPANQDGITEGQLKMLLGKCEIKGVTASDLLTYLNNTGYEINLLSDIPQDKLTTVVQQVNSGFVKPC